mmetsp:Transcript_21792/g.43769  ORF Transcript_21792/g.43769 Transcript_21792/m.43769 type:complete len:301 (-) Transcript_21792:1941-2843(-)
MYLRTATERRTIGRLDMNDFVSFTDRPEPPRPLTPCELSTWMPIGPATQLTSHRFGAFMEGIQSVDEPSSSLTNSSRACSVFSRNVRREEGSVEMALSRIAGKGTEARESFSLPSAPSPKASRSFRLRSSRAHVSSHSSWTAEVLPFLRSPHMPGRWILPHSHWNMIFCLHRVLGQGWVGWHFALHGWPHSRRAPHAMPQLQTNGERGSSSAAAAGSSSFLASSLPSFAAPPPSIARSLWSGPVPSSSSSSSQPSFGGMAASLASSLGFFFFFFGWSISQYSRMDRGPRFISLAFVHGPE